MMSSCTAYIASIYSGSKNSAYNKGGVFNPLLTIHTVTPPIAPVRYVAGQSIQVLLFVVIYVVQALTLRRYDTSMVMMMM